jgi:hypothetical protein
MNIGELKSAFENTESNYNRMNAEAEWADKQFSADAANEELRGRERKAQEVLNTSSDTADSKRAQVLTLRDLLLEIDESQTQIIKEVNAEISGLE